MVGVAAPDHANVAAEVTAHVNFNGRRKLFATLSGRPFTGDSRQLSDEQRRAEAVQAREFLLSLSLGNTVFPQPDEKTGVPVLKGSSPDEEALVEVRAQLSLHLFYLTPSLHLSHLFLFTHMHCTV